jgi:hypothetical protein
MGQHTTTTTVPIYEPEPAQRRLLGSATVSESIWWSGALTVPEDSNGLAFLELTRHGPSTRGDDKINVMVLPTELIALRVLVEHLTASAER